MRTTAIIWACLACAGHVFRVQRTQDGVQESAGEDGLTSQVLEERVHSPRSFKEQSKALARFLVNLRPQMTRSPVAAWQVTGLSPELARSKGHLKHAASQSAGDNHILGKHSLPTQSPSGTKAAIADARMAGTSMVATLDRLAEGLAEVRGIQRSDPSQKIKVMIAGGGIGGLCAAVVLKNEGYEVKVFEKTKEYRPFGGPIQIATNALESIRRIDEDVYRKIIASSTVIGDRINGLKDGISNEWFATFDLFSPAKKRQQDPSVVIDRPVLQDILLSRVKECVFTGKEVISYEQKPNHGGVVGHLSDGSQYEADFLIGSDGIRSKVRELFYPNPKEPVWSGYTCFAAIANCVPHDIETVGYKVFLGSRKYFVSVDVGGGRIQWYAFLNIPPRSLSLSPSESLKYLKEEQFNGWNEEVHQLLDSTPEDQIEQRDLYDRAPEPLWSKDNVCLLGDAAHPMMPNLGQGGGMAIEDALVLGQELRKLSEPDISKSDIPQALENYNDKRHMRAAAVQGMSRLSSAILFQYNHPTRIESLSPLKITNYGPRSLITRACQGFLQHVAFPLQFEFLFSFPGNAIEPEVWVRDPVLDSWHTDLDWFGGELSIQEYWRRYMR